MKFQLALIVIALGALAIASLPTFARQTLIDTGPLEELSRLFPQARVMAIPTIESLQERMVQLQDEAEAIQDAANGESRELTDSERTRIDSIFAAFEQTETDLKRLEKLHAQGGRIATSAGRRTDPNDIVASGGRQMTGSPRHSGRPSPSNNHQTPTSGAVGRRFADLFGAEGISMEGFRGRADYFQSIALNRPHPHLRIMNSNVEGIGVDGGFLVPAQLLADLIDGAIESEIVRPRARVYGMTSNEMRIPGVDYRDHSSKLGNVEGVWMGEGDTATPQQLKLRALRLRANKLAIYTRASNELAEDAPGFDRMLVDALQTGIHFDLDYAFFNGNGVGRPLGILAAPSRITVAKESSQAADTILYENIVKMWSRLHPACMSTAIWVASNTIVPQLFHLAFKITNVAGTENVGGVPVYTPANANGSPATLLGRPLVFTEKVPVLGDEGDLTLVDLNQYAVGIRRLASLQRSLEPGWLTDESDWRLILRATGQPLWASAVTPRHGDTLSWCVTLAERA